MPLQTCYSLIGHRHHPIILFLHGFLGDGNEFNEAISLLSDQFCCLIVDLPGHGQTIITGGDECYTLSNTAQELINLLNKLKIQKCFLCGYSMGGRLALYLTLAHPQRFSKVILESASPGLKTEAERQQRRQRDWQLAEELETGSFSAFIIKWYNQPLFASLKNHPNFERILELRLRNNPLALAKSLRNFSTGNQPSLWENLKQNQIPLLLLVGDADEKFKLINTEMAKLCQRAQLKIINNCGHNIHFENVNAFTNVLRNYFTEI